MYSMEIKVFGMRCRVELIVLSMVVGALLGGHLLCSCVTVSAKDVKEGMHNMLGSADISYKMGNGVKSSWENKSPESNAQDLSTHMGPKVPLPAGQLFFFANNKFSADCCVSPQSGVSSAEGCACVTKEQVNYISARGGNNEGGNYF